MTVEDLIRIYWPTGDIPEFEHAVVLHSEGEPICHVGVTLRNIAINGEQFQVGGIGYVCTAPGWEHRGLMHKTMYMAHDQLKWVHEQTFVLLNTGHQGLYEEFGYARRPNLPGEWMSARLSESLWDDEWTIDLQGTW